MIYPRKLELKARIVAAGMGYRDVARLAEIPYARLCRLIGGWSAPRAGEMERIEGTLKKQPPQTVETGK